MNMPAVAIESMPAPETAVSSNNPYVGPRTFVAEQADRFFGREMEAGELLSIVVANRLTLFYAESGAGKSSLINTRLIPNLRAKHYEVLPLARVGGDEGSLKADNPYTYNLIRRLLPDEDEEERYAHLELKDFLKGYVYDVNRYVYLPPDSPSCSSPGILDPVITLDSSIVPRVLIIDQFEEMLTTYPRSQKQGEFFDQLTEAMREDPFLRVVLSMRQDYVAGLDPYAHRTIDGLRTRYLMQRMGEQAALQAVRLPAERIGKHPFDEDVSIDLVRNLRQEPTQSNFDESNQLSDFIDPVQLQVVCYQLWEDLSRLGRPAGASITRDDMRLLMGGSDMSEFVNQALSKFYEQAIKKVLSAHTGVVTERQLRDWFSKQLITSDNTRGLWFPGNKSISEGGMPQAVIDELVGQFIIRPERRGRSTWYELVHDRFILPIRNVNADWLRSQSNFVTLNARSWQENNCDPRLLLRTEQLKVAMAYADANPGVLGSLEQEFIEESRKRLEREHLQAQAVALKRRNRQFWMLLGFSIVAFIITLVAGFFAFEAGWQKAQAQREAIIANALRLSSLSLLDTNPDRRLLFAIKAVIDAQQNNASFTIEQTSLVKALAEVDSLNLVSGVIPNEGLIEPQKVAFDENLQHVVVAAGANRALWSLNPDLAARKTNRVNLHKIDASSFVVSAMSQDSRWVAAGTEDGTVLLWDTNNPDPTQAITLTGHTDSIRDMAFSLDDHWLATASDDMSVRLWDLRSRDGMLTSHLLKGHEDRINSIEFSHNGQWLASGSDDATVRLWDISKPDLSMDAKVLDTQNGYVTDVAFDNKDSRLAIGSDDGSVFVWPLTELASDIRPTRVITHTDSVIEVLFSPDGQWLASGGKDNRVGLVNTNNPAQAWLMDGHTAPVTHLAFSPDNRWLVSSSQDATLRRWDMKARDLQSSALAIKGHTGAIASVVFHPGGEWFATVSKDGTVKRWNTGSWARGLDELLDQACQEVERPTKNLSADELKEYELNESNTTICPSPPRKAS